MKINKYQLLSFMILFGILLGSGWNMIIQSSNQIVNDKIQPQSAQTSGLDFEITSHGSYWDPCEKIFYLSITVKSPSGSMPTNVTADMNGTNYTLNIEYYTTWGFRGNNISTGITYTNYVCNIIEGNYTIFYHIINATGTFIKNYSIIVDNSLINYFSAGYRQIDRCNYEIYAALWLQENCTLPINATIGIQNLNYSMTWRSIEKEWYYTYIGNCSINFLGISYNITLIYANGYTQFLAGWLWFSPLDSDISVDQIHYISQNTTSGEITYEFYFQYIDWHNLTIQNLTIEKNGVNSSLTIKIPENYYRYDQNEECYEIDWLSGVILGPYRMNFQTNTAINLTIWAFDGTNWVSAQIWYNKTWQLAPTADIAINFLNQTIYIKNGAYYANITFNITSLIAGFDIDQLYIIFQSPINTGYSTSFTQTDGTDIDFTDGKGYIRDQYLTSQLSPLYGIFEFYLVIYYTNNSYDYIGIWESIIFNITISTQTLINLPVKANEWYVFESTSFYNSCCQCEASVASNSSTAYEIITTGLRLGVNFIKYRYYYWSKSCNNTGAWFNSYQYRADYYAYLMGFVHHFIDEYRYMYVDPNDARSYSTFTVINFDKYYEYYQNRSSISYFTKTTNKISLDWTSGCANLKYYILVNSKGIITEWNSIYKIGTCYQSTSKTMLIAAGSGSIPKTLEDVRKESTYQPSGTDNLLSDLMESILPPGFWAQIGISSFLLIAVGITLFAQKLKNKDSGLSSGGNSKDTNEPSMN